MRATHIEPIRLETFLGADRLPVLRQIARQADLHGWHIYLVGGPVRDLLLGLPANDIDLVVEGNAMILAQEMASLMHATLLGHSQFGTATLTFPQGDLYLDIVTARREYYAHVAALPLVEPATLQDDLLRRDFSINSMALGLNTDIFAQLYDIADGQADLQRGLMRVLHKQSFIDDPTRMLRMARIAARLDFRIEEHTRALVDSALEQQVFQYTTPVRILHELELCLAEQQPGAALNLLDQLGILAAIHPALGWNQCLADRLVQSLKHNQVYSEKDGADLRLLVLLYSIGTQQRHEIAEYFRLSRHRRQLIEDIDRIQNARELLSADFIANSVLDRGLHGLHDLALDAAILAESSPIPERLEYYRSVLRPRQPALNGNSLRAMHIPPGPLYAMLLEGLRAAVLDGLVTTEEEQRTWIKKILNDE